MAMAGRLLSGITKSKPDSPEEIQRKAKEEAEKKAKKEKEEADKKAKKEGADSVPARAMTCAKSSCSRRCREEAHSELGG